MADVIYRGHEISPRLNVGGSVISRDGEYVDNVLGGVAEAKVLIDEFLARRDPASMSLAELSDAIDREMEQHPDGGSRYATRLIDYYESL